MEFAYDALGKRIETADWTVASNPPKRTRFIYDGQVVLAEIDSVANPRRWFVHGTTYIDEHIMVYDAVSGAQHYYLLKELYSVAGLADDSGRLVEAYRYDAYGKVHIFKPDTAAGDSDNDKDVDLADFAAFANCLNVDTSQDPSCDFADARDDDLITLDDYASIFPCQTGAYPPIVAGGDYDQDNDVDSDDLSQFMTCWLNPPPSSACLTHFDFDGNGAIDIDDYGTMLGLLNPSTPACFVPANTSTANPYFFTGQPLDWITFSVPGEPYQLSDYRARYYAASDGRFMQRDPLDYEYDANLYAYVGCAPNTWLDPMGFGPLGIPPVPWPGKPKPGKPKPPKPKPPVPGSKEDPVDITADVEELMREGIENEAGTCFRVNPRADLDFKVMITRIDAGCQKSKEELEKALQGLVDLGKTLFWFSGYEKQCEKGCCQDKKPWPRQHYCLRLTKKDVSLEYVVLPKPGPNENGCTGDLTVNACLEMDGWRGRCVGGTTTKPGKVSPDE
jgi:RHS repeat-associated protein